MTASNTNTTRTKEQQREIADTIIAQLGGRQFIMLTGSKNFGFDEKGLSFRVGTNEKRVTHVKIDYDGGADAYDVYFYSLRGTDLRVVAEHHGIFSDQLQDLFENATGLYVTLRRRG